MKSRCGVFYLRWPLPKQLHPQNKATTLKFSLQTRNPRKALRLSRFLSQIGERLNGHGISYGMRYEELRSKLIEHFEHLLEQAKAEMNESGPLSEFDRQLYKTQKLIAKQARETDMTLSLVQSDDDLLDRFIERYDLNISKGGPEYRWLEREMKSSFHAFVKAVLAYDKSLQRYDFNSAPASSVMTNRKRLAQGGMTIEETVDAYSKERQRGKAWAAKTILEKADHFKLLGEILGNATDMRILTAMDAKRVKDTLLVYPRNRSKNPKTRGKALEEVLAISDVETIQVATINKYLQTYSELFEWAKQNHHITENLFSGLTVKQSSRGKVDSRVAYTDEQIRLILSVC
jgi:hypothetical protein